MTRILQLLWHLGGRHSSEALSNSQIGRRHASTDFSSSIGLYVFAYKNPFSTSLILNLKIKKKINKPQ
jgi:hypothetical protein